MNKILKYSLIGIMLLSLFANMYLLMTIGYVALEYEDEMYYNDLGWCDYSNIQTGVINELIERLRGYDEMYDEIEFVEELDCWEE